MSWRRPEEKGLPKNVVKELATFGFGKGSLSDDQFLDMRSDVENKSMMQALLYYRTLQECYGSKAAGKIANILERLSVSTNREGRKEAVTTLVGGQFRKPEEIIRAYEDITDGKKTE